ncbi:MAG: cytochrome c3 family protein [Acidobacteria bacterium]|nr:cytochrome c3 family protein [Acidobacteriota bacterium]
MAPASACKGCHKTSGDTYKGKLDKDGKPVHKNYSDGGLTREMNFHDSHQGDIRCTICHTTHTEPSKLYCNDCHSFRVEIK